jgi:hypothetical protein
MNTVSIKTYSFPLLVLFLGIFILVLILPSGPNAQAQSSDIIWSQPINVSNSPGLTSTDVFLLGDPGGKAHLFWGEKKSDIPGNQPDTLMYTAWDGNTWARPIDIFFSPISDGTPIAAYPRAIMDDRGYIHLIWLTQPNFPRYSLNYSVAYAPRASDAHAWKPKVVLAEDLTGTKYSLDIAFNPEQGIHILYARVEQGDNPPEERAVTHISSSDYGETWSDPQDIYTVRDLNGGASDVRMLLEPPANVYSSWTQWGISGNGQGIVFTQSTDSGDTWEQARMLVKRIGNEYERDWNNMASLGPGQIVTIFEGGWRAYRNAMYSFDAGESWSDPVDIFPWLIGENGSVEFARDSTDKLHLFIAQRVREGMEKYGDTDREGLWHSVWEGAQRWSEPTLSNGLNAMINPKVVIINGNQVVAAWYAPPDYEIITMIGRITEAPYTEPISWPPEIQPEPLVDNITPVPTATEALESTPIGITNISSETDGSATDSRTAVGIIAGVTASLVILGMLIFIAITRQNK